MSVVANCFKLITATPLRSLVASRVFSVSRKALLAAGLAMCLLAALLMLADVVGVGWGAAIGMIGIGVISTSAAKR